MVVVGTVLILGNTSAGRVQIEKLVARLTGGNVQLSGLAGSFPSHLRLEELKLKDAAALPGSLRIVLSETETEAMLKDVLQSHSNVGVVILALGPEGGWTDEELKLFQEAGWLSASLGSTILRAETAAIASLAVALSELQA